MKEWFALFIKSDSLQICSFHHAFPRFMPKTKERNVLKDDIFSRHSLKKSEESDSHFEKNDSHLEKS